MNQVLGLRLSHLHLAHLVCSSQTAEKVVEIEILKSYITFKELVMAFAAARMIIQRDGKGNRKSADLSGDNEVITGLHS